MPYARIANRMTPVSAPPTGKHFIDRTTDATAPTGVATRVTVAFGLSLLSVVLGPGKVFPLHLRESYMRMYFYLKELRFPLQADGSCVAMSVGGIYAGDLALLSPVRPDFQLTDDIEANMDAYGIAIAFGSDVCDYYRAGSMPVKNAFVECLDFGKNAAGHL
ncbi:MAG: hypothetical protein KAS32_29050 [Candidatus Peribacteraceae bacterium]|nr:hypothetical protein [Candidatus Peribacteraceae bacterium]